MEIKTINVFHWIKICFLTKSNLTLLCSLITFTLKCVAHSHSPCIHYFLMKSVICNYLIFTFQNPFFPLQIQFNILSHGITLFVSHFSSISFESSGKVHYQLPDKTVSASSFFSCVNFSFRL